MRPRLVLATAVALLVSAAVAPPAFAATVDLEVTSVAPLSTPVCVGSTPTIRALIRNNGTSDSGSFNIRWVVDGGLTFDGGHNSIAAGATDSHDHIWSSGPGAGPTPVAAGSHTVRFIANFDGAVPETSSANNERTLTFTTIDCATQGSYVALGDSFSSGDGANNYISTSSAEFVPHQGKDCRRSSNAYPEVLKLGLNPTGVTIPAKLLFAACTGDTVLDVLRAQFPVFKATDASAIKLVTITVGGDDVGFGPKLRQCWLGGTSACLAQSAGTTQQIIALANRLTLLYKSIKSATPNARVLVLGYPDLFPVRPSGDCQHFTRESQTWINSEERLLNAVTYEAARQAHVDFVATFDSFVGHDVCAGKDAYVTFVPASLGQWPPMHPNGVGQATLAKVVGDYLQAHPAAP